MSFIAVDNPPPANPEPPPVHNLAFWPPITLARFRDAYRVTEAVTDERAVTALQAAVILINDELEAWRQAQQAEGHATLAEVPAQSYGEGEAATTAKVHHYQAAVYHTAKARILERYRDYDSTKSGHDRADALDDTADEHHKLARHALRALQDLPLTVVELI